MTIRDSAEDSAAAAGDVLELCKMVNEPAERWWLVGLLPLLCVADPRAWREIFDARARALWKEALLVVRIAPPSVKKDDDGSVLLSHRVAGGGRVSRVGDKHEVSFTDSQETAVSCTFTFRKLARA